MTAICAYRSNRGAGAAATKDGGIQSANKVLAIRISAFKDGAAIKLNSLPRVRGNASLGYIRRYIYDRAINREDIFLVA